MAEVRKRHPANDEIELDFRKIILVLKKWAKFILVFTLITTLAVALMNYYLLTPIYQAKALLMVTVASEKLQVSTNPVNRTDPATGNTATMPILTMNTYLGQLKSEALMKRVQSELGLGDQTIGSISNKIEAKIVENSNLIEIKVNHANPEMALAIANAVSDQYLELMKEFMFSSVVVISPANLPKTPVKPNKQLNIIIAFIFGLSASISLAFLLEYLDNTFKTAEDVARELQLNVLGLIPVISDNTTRQNS